MSEIPGYLDKSRKRCIVLSSDRHCEVTKGAVFWYMECIHSELLYEWSIIIQSSDPDSVSGICEKKKKAGAIQENQRKVKPDESSLSFYCCIWEVIIHPSIRWIHRTDQCIHVLFISPPSTINIDTTTLLWFNLHIHLHHTHPLFNCTNR